MSELLMGRTIPEEEARGMAAQMVGEWLIITTSCLVETVGPEKAVESLRPYYRSLAIETWQKGSEKVQLQGDSVMLLALNLKFGNCVIGSPCDVEIKERGIDTTHRECFSSGFRFPLVWCQLHEISHKAHCEAIAPEYDFCFIQMMPDGKAYCKGVVRKKTEEPNQWEDGGATRAVVLEPIITDTIRRIEVEMVCGIWTMTVEAFMDTVGEEEAMNALQPYMIENGASWGLRFIDLLGVERHEIGLPKLLEFVNIIMQLHGETTIRPDRVDEQILSCPFSNESGAICRLFHSFIEGLSYSLAPEMMFTRKQKCPSQPFCHWTFKRAEERYCAIKPQGVIG